MKTIGVLAFHGDVIEHITATQRAIHALKITARVVEVTEKSQISCLHALIIPGGESTTMFSLCQREHMIGDIKKIPAIMGTCAGAIMLAKNILHSAPDQGTLELMNITVDRNAYGRQTESFEETIQTKLGTIPAVFIRAPKITSVAKSVTILAMRNGDILACEETKGKHYYMALTFHPELTTPLFHEYFLKHL